MEQHAKKQSIATKTFPGPAQPIVNTLHSNIQKAVPAAIKGPGLLYQTADITHPFPSPIVFPISNVHNVKSC